MNESERFVAAAIAFAWRYDEPQFRDHFWKSVCRFNDDPELTDKAEIRVEPYRWADLLITNPTRKPAGFGFDKGNWFLVVELLTSDKEPARSLKCLVSPPSSYLAWFGYKEKKEVRRPWVFGSIAGTANHENASPQNSGLSRTARSMPLHRLNTSSSL